MLVFWLTATPWDATAGAAATVRATSIDMGQATTLNNVEWLPVLAEGPTISTTVFDGAAVTSTPSTVGEVVLTAQLGEIDAWADYVWNQRPCQIYYADVDVSDPTAPVWPTFGSLTLIFDGVIETYDANKASFTLSVELPAGKVASSTYAGTGGINGAAEVKGVVVPWASGRHLNREAVLVDPALQLYQVHGYGPIEEFTYFRESGNLLDQTRVSQSTAAALAAATVAETEIHYCLAAGMFRLGFTPVGTITVDFKGDNGGGTFSARPGVVIKRLLTATGWSTSFIAQDSLDDLDASIPYDVFCYDDAGEDVLNLISNILTPLGGYWDVDATGTFFVGLFRDKGSVDFSVGEAALGATYDAFEFDELPTRAPFWRNRLGYAFNPTVFDGQSLNISDVVSTISTDTYLYRTSGAPTNKPFPLSITPDVRPNATVNYTLTWAHYQQGDLPADFLVIFYMRGTGTPTVIASDSVQIPINQAWTGSYTFEGLDPAATLSFGMAAGRRTPRGVEITAITSFTGGGTRTNLLLQSQTFGNASWTKTGATVTADAAVAPDGTTTADRLISSVSTGSNTAFAGQQVTVTTATDYIFSVYLKPGTSPTTVVNFYRVSPFDQSVLTITWGATPAISFTGNGWAYGLFDLGNGWYRAWIAMNSATATALMARIYTRDQGTTHVSGEYVDIWGAMIDAATTARPYVATVAATASATNPSMQGLGGGAVSFTGNIGSTLATTVEANSIAAYSGTVAYRTTGAPTNAPYPVSLPVPSQNTNGTVNWTLTWDHYVQGAKQADALVLFWRKDGTAPTVNDASITMTVNTTWRSYYVMEGVNPADTYSFGIAAARRTEVGWEIGPIQTFDGTQSRTNIVLQSRAFGSTWVPSATTVTGNPAGITAPDGATLTADRLVEAATTAAHYISQATTVTSGQVYQESVYVLAGERSVFQIAALTGTAGGTTAYQNFDLANGVLGSGTGFAAVGIQNVGGGWFRCWVEDTASAASASFALAIVPAANSGRLASYLGDITKGLYLWGAMRELKTNFVGNGGPSPWFNTTTGTVTVTGPDMLGVTVGAANITATIDSRAATDISTTVAAGGGVATNQVSTGSVQANAVSERPFANVGSTITLTTSMQTIFDFTLNATMAGEPQNIRGQVDCNDTVYEGSMTSVNFTIQKCNASTGAVVSTIVSDRTYGSFSDENIASGFSCPFSFMDTPDATNRRYKVLARQVDSSASVVQTSSFITSEGLKR